MNASDFAHDHSKTPTSTHKDCNNQETTNSKGTLDLPLWNVEGLKSIMQNAPDTTQNHDIIVLTETFLTEYTAIPGYYTTHSYAVQKQEGRPSGGVSCIYNNKIGEKIAEYKEDNMVHITTTYLEIIGLYIPPQTNIEDAIEKIASAVSRLDHKKPAILAGDINCRIDIPDKKTQEVTKLLQEEGFCLANRTDVMTYIAPNGCSCIDLVFKKGNDRNRTTNNKNIINFTTKETPTDKHKIQIWGQRTANENRNKHPEKNKKNPKIHIGKARGHHANNRTKRNRRCRTEDD